MSETGEGAETTEGGAKANDAPGMGSGAGTGTGGHAAEGQLSEVVVDLLGRLWRRGRVEVEKAAKKGRERLTLRQLRSDRDRMYQKLGKEVRHLVEAGEIDHPGLKRGVERIRELEARIQEAEDQMRAVGLEPDADVPADPPNDASPSE